LARLDTDIDVRRQAVIAYRRALESLESVELPWSDEAVRLSSHFAFPILLPDREARDAFRTAMGDLGIQTTWYPALPSLSFYKTEPARRANEVADRHCALPLSSTTTLADVADVADCVARAVEAV
jgi:dTDP-4-amino-4,6-dideoxygalactose transaminase